MRDRYPAYTPPDYTPDSGADYTPAPPAGEYGTDVFGQPAPERYGPPPKPKTPGQAPGRAPKARRSPARLLIIIGLIGLCSCLAMTVAAVVAMRGFVSDSAFESLSAEDPERMAEWLSWSPDVPEPLAAAPAEKTDLIEQCVGEIAPGFEVDATAWRNGDVDESGEYHADLALVRATHPAADHVWAAIEFLILSDEMVAQDLYFDVEESMSVTGTADAYEFAYEPQWGEGGYSLDTEEGTALWREIGVDWPMAVVMEIADQPGGGAESTAMVELTTWEAYAIDEASPRVYATYERYGAQWSLVKWEYWYSAEESPEQQTGT